MANPNPYAPPSAPVADIAEAGTHQLAGRGTRLGAVVLDGVIASLLIYAPAAAMIDWRGLIASGGTSAYAPFMDGRVLMAAAPGSLLLIAVTWYLVKRNGQTIGKKLLGIKVVRSNGERAGVGRIFWLRNVIVAVLSAIPFIGGLIGLIDSLLIFRQSRQCLHDQIADTIVIQA